jgi:hypothetical protein
MTPYITSSIIDEANVYIFVGQESFTALTLLWFIKCLQTSQAQQFHKILININLRYNHISDIYME